MQFVHSFIQVVIILFGILKQVKLHIISSKPESFRSLHSCQDDSFQNTFVIRLSFLLVQQHIILISSLYIKFSCHILAQIISAHYPIYLIRLTWMDVSQKINNNINF